MTTSAHIRSADTAWGANAARIVAYALTAIIAIRLRLPPDLHLGTIVGLALLPVTLTAVQRYRGGFLLFTLSVAAAISGVILTYSSAADHEIQFGPMVTEALRIAGIGVCVVSLLWARSVVGIYRVAFAYGIGALASVFLTGVNVDNLWKFSLSVPIILLLLSLPVTTRTVARQFVAVLTLAAVSGLADSRSLAATLLIASALLLIRRSPVRGNGASAWSVVLQIAVIGIGGFYALQGAILGVLGEQIQARTQAQIQTSGNLITGGRPELGATVALLRNQPTGFGTGTLPSFTDIMIAKEGMVPLGYNPVNNGYVDRYMFGSKFEVHSLFGDLWLLGGLLGAALGVTILVMVIYGMARSIAVGTASAVALFLGVRATWDFFFSPIGTTFFTLCIALALLLPEITRRAAPEALPTTLPPLERS